MTSSGSNGLCEVELTDWREINEFIEENFFTDNNFVFRGQRDSNWALQTSLDRLLHSVPKEFLNENIVYSHLNRFRRAIRGRRGANPAPIDRDNDLWALGQHYGLGTPLLDWSFSPYISLFFAFNEVASPTTGKRSLFALNLKKVREISRNLIDWEGLQRSEGKPVDWECEIFEEDRTPVIEIVEPLTDDNPRIINQAGLFTRLPILMTLDQWVSNFSSSYSKVLYKITIPEDEREDIVWALEKMNIHSAALFPDITGASSYCNEMLSILVGKKQVLEEANKLSSILGISSDDSVEI